VITVAIAASCVQPIQFTTFVLRLTAPVAVMVNSAVELTLFVGDAPVTITAPVRTGSASSAQEEKCAHCKSKQLSFR